MMLRQRSTGDAWRAARRFLWCAVAFGVVLIIAAPPASGEAPPPLREDAEINQQLDAARQGAGLATAVSDPTVFIVKIINTSLTLLGAVFVALLVYAGYLWMTAGGEGDQLDKAKGILKTAVIGLIIVLIAYAASAFIVNKLVEATTAR